MKRTSDWYKLIADHDWIYGDSTEESLNGQLLYKIETGQIETKYIYFNNETSRYEEGTYTWNTEIDKVTAKIALPYLHDLYLTYYDGVTEETRGSASSEDEIKNLWLSDYFVMTIVRCPHAFPSSGLFPCIRMNNGDYIIDVSDVRATVMGGYVHPTFYLPNTIEMEGTGIETDPYRIVN